MLQIEDLHVSRDGHPILRGINLHVAAGEVHAIMGPNGSGKTTLSQVLAGHPGYEVTHGNLIFNGQDLSELSTEERAIAGIFLAFQYPVEIPGVNNAYFLKAALNARRRAHNEPELDAVDFLSKVRKQMTALQMDPRFLERPVNEGFSGGEKKRNEVLQMAILEPKLALLDETDSGLDIDALRIVAEGVTRLRAKERAFVVVTHYQRLLDYIVPDKVHVLAQGRIVRSGGKELALELEAEGYQNVEAHKDATNAVGAGASAAGGLR